MSTDPARGPLVIHPDEAQSKLRTSDNVVIFADAVHSGHALVTQAQRLKRLGVRWSAFSCLDLRPPSIKKGMDRTALVSALEWEFPEFLRAGLPPGAKVLTADAISNEISEQADVSEFSDQYSTFAWSSSGSLTGARQYSEVDNAARKQALDVIEAVASFHYGLQFVDGVYHVVRVSVRPLIENQVFFDLMAKWLANAVQPWLTTAGTDIVIFCRDESDFTKYRVQLSNRLAVLLSNSKEWRGHIFSVVVPVTRKGARQIIDQRAKALLGKARFEGGSINSTGIEELPLVASAHTVEDQFVGIFLDNATISGRALRDFSLAMASVVEEPRAQVLLLCPLVSRLSPSEEQFLLRADTLKTDGLGGGSLALRFSAYLQMRVGTHQSLDVVPGIIRVRETPPLFRAQRRPSTIYFASHTFGMEIRAFRSGRR